MAEQQQPTMADRVAEWQLEASCTRIPARTDGSGSSWDKNARHWVCELRTVGRGHCEPIAVQFSQGSAHTKRPTAIELLDCLAMDAMIAEQHCDHYGMCEEFGDTPSRRTEQTYRACCDARDKLVALIGRKNLEALWYETERL